MIVSCRRFAMFACVLLLAGSALMRSASAQPASLAPRELALYEGVAPGSEKWNWEETLASPPPAQPIVRNVVRPVLQYYPADKARAVGTAMIVAPGGGFRMLMMSYEGADVAKRLNEMGVDAFVLKYRLKRFETTPSTPRPAAPAAKKSGEPAPADIKALITGDPSGPQAGQNLLEIGGADAQQAVRVLRQRAGEFGFRPDRIGMIGFSAGGAVTLRAVMGPAETRPNFAAPVYGAIGVDSAPAADAPPLFIATAADDTTVPSQTSIDLFTAWRKANLPAELHVFQTGSHGFRKKGGGADHFMDRLEEWLKVNGWLAKAAR
jgi:acetyl esterase/lipase